MRTAVEPHSSEEQSQSVGRSSSFAIAMAVTADYAEMASGLLAKVREYHPEADLFLYTDEASRECARSLADAFSATDLATARAFDYSCGDWNNIVTVKFDIFGRKYADPILYLDTDQILYRDLTPFVELFAESGAALAGSPDDENFAAQFKPGAAPEGVPAEAPCFNTGAFLLRADAALQRRILGSLDYFADRGRLPTQSVLNGVAQMEGLPLVLFGEQFMAGPFSRRVLDQPRTSALIHLWTPRPPFMKPNPVRQGESSYEVLKQRFAERFGASYPEEQLEREYTGQLDLARRVWRSSA